MAALVAALQDWHDNPHRPTSDGQHSDSLQTAMKIKSFKSLADVVRNNHIDNKNVLFDAIEKSQNKIILFLSLRNKTVYCTWAKSLNGPSVGSHAKTSIVEKSFSLRIKDARCLVVPPGIIAHLRLRDISHWFSFDKVCISNPALSQSDPNANIGMLSRTDPQKIYNNTQLLIKSADEHQIDLRNCLINLFSQDDKIKSAIVGGDYPQKLNNEVGEENSTRNGFKYSPFYFLADGDEEECSDVFSRNMNIKNPFEFEVGLEDVLIHQDDLRTLGLIPRHSFPLLGDDEIETLEKQLLQSKKIANFIPEIRKAFFECWMNQNSAYVFRGNLLELGKSKKTIKIAKESLQNSANR